MTWESTPLSEVVKVRRGHDLPTRVRKPGMIPVVSSGGVSGYHDTAIADGPGVVLGRATNLGQPTWVDGPYWPHNTTLYVEDFLGNDPRWVYWWFKTNDLSGFNSGSVQPMLNRNYIAKVPVSLPPLEEQERIAAVLGAFDDLIEMNRRLASDLETLAKSVSSRPRGRVPLAQLADVPRLVQRRPEGLVDHYSIPAYDSGYLAYRESSESILSGKQMLVTDSVLISRLNPTTERTWMAYPDEHVSAVCSPEFAVVRGTEELPSEVLWAFASRPDFWDQMRGSVGGTTNSRQRVDKSAIPAFEVPDPNELSEPEVATIERCVRAAVHLRREAAAVSSQRAELLPLLMSGKARVRDVEAAVS